MTTKVDTRTRGDHRHGTRWRAYARLAKLDVFDYYLGLLVVVAALPAAARFEARNLLTLGVFLLGEVFVIAAMVALDDITGYLDGSDLVNYAPDAPARRVRRKPLVAGTLDVGHARRFAAVAAAAGALCWAVAVLVAPARPAWAIGVVVVTFVVALQYSWGLKLSYHGAQELFLAALGWALVLAPYGLLTGVAGRFIAVQAVLFGLGPVLFGVYSNTNDIAGDRSVGRVTVASRVCARTNALFVGTLSIMEAVVVLGSVALGAAPWWFPVLMTPVIGLRGVQYVTGMVRGQILRARLLGVRIHRLSVALLVLANLIAGGAALAGGIG